MDQDADLAAIRAQRMAEMQAGTGGGGGDQAKKQQEAMKRQDEAKNGMLAQILTQKARARLNSIALVKPAKARAIENMLIQMARTGQIGGKLDEEPLINLIEKLNEQVASESKVTIQRRRHAVDSDED